MSQPLNWYGIERSVPIDSSASCFVTMMVLGLGVSVGDISLINRMVLPKRMRLWWVKDGKQSTMPWMW
jgi:hypothetical protein